MSLCLGRYPKQKTFIIDKGENNKSIIIDYCSFDKYTNEITLKIKSDDNVEIEVLDNSHYEERLDKYLSNFSEISLTQDYNNQEF